MLLRKNDHFNRTPCVPTADPRVHILMYTFNKAHDLRNTLRSLKETTSGNYKLFIVNNGSRDGTERLLYSMKGSLIDDMKIINLPVNIGAPAARNWLLHDPENGYADFLVYLDDDILLPHGWLNDMLSTFNNFPEAGVVGGKIVFSGMPKIIQHTGGIITSPHEWINNIQCHSFEQDHGQHDYVAERHYVMGCAHMYRKEVFDVVGDFDLRFSPTQFDEVEHQLRMRLFGYEAIYNGHIEIVHMLKSGMKQSEAAQISREANRLKMLPLFSTEEIEALVSENLLEKEPSPLRRCSAGR